jgi:hypothetical protein
MVTNLHLKLRTHKPQPVPTVKRMSLALVKVIAVLVVSSNVLP